MASLGSTSVDPLDQGGASSTPMVMSTSTPPPSTPLTGWAPPSGGPAAAAAGLKKSRTLRALEEIRTFLESTTCYDILPESFRLIVFDNKLSITRSLQALVTNGVVSAPLYNSSTQRFAGMFTLADVVHLIQYYYLHAHEYENVVTEVESFQLGSLRQIEQAIDVPPPPTIAVHPSQSLADACAALVRTHARRLPLVDRDEQTGRETIVSVLTTYRVLKFIAINSSHSCAKLDQSIGSLGIGSYVSWWEPVNSSGGTGDNMPLPPVEPNSSPSANTSPHIPPPLSSIPERSSPPPGGEGEGADGDREADDGREPPTPTLSSMQSAEKELKGPPVASSATVLGQRARARSLSASRGSGDPGAFTPVPAAEEKSESPQQSKEKPKRQQSEGISDRFHPLATASMGTSVFDVVHIFSERGISAVPIVDEDGVVLNLYETVDIVDLVRTNAYDILDKTVGDALAQRSPDFGGVITCTPEDTLASILAYVRERRIHRFVIVEGDDVPSSAGRPARKKGALVGILSLSDILRFLVGHENLKGHEVRGLGVHGLRGVTGVLTEEDVNALKAGGVATEELDMHVLTGLSERRGSETTDIDSQADEHDSAAFL